MIHYQQIQIYRNKANQAKTLYEVEFALRDISETLKIHQTERVINILSGNPDIETPYERQLLAERDAYLERWQKLNKSKSGYGRKSNA